MKPRIYLSPPDMGGAEERFVKKAFESNWIAPLGPQVDAFEREFCAVLGGGHAAALNSGTAALHLALRLNGVGPGDTVFCSTLTFVASANPILYQGARPVFIDSEPRSWNMDPNCLETALAAHAQRNQLPKAVILVHLYGQSADLDSISALCQRYGVPLIEDAAEALGALYQDRAVGTLGRCGAFSFNGNKILTTSGGGMLVSHDKSLIDEARRLAAQARDQAPHYQHSITGYNYRLSNILAGIGRGQLQTLSEKIRRCRAHFTFYQKAFEQLPGIQWMPELEGSRSTRWLTCLTIDTQQPGSRRDDILAAMEQENIECRPLWKPMHLQPLFEGCEYFGGRIAEKLFQTGLCLPSGSNLTDAERDRVVRCFIETFKKT